MRTMSPLTVSEVETARLQALRAHVAADAARRQIAVVARRPSAITSPDMVLADLQLAACRRRRDVAADRFRAHRALHARHLDVSGNRIQRPRDADAGTVTCSRPTRDRVTLRGRYRRAHVDAAGALVHDDVRPRPARC